MSSQLDRITEMENALDECVLAAQALDGELERMDALRNKMIILFSYYGSEQWYQDRETPLPATVKAGVLSEDSVYDLIAQVRDAAFHMLELSTDILKNRI